MFDYKIKPQNWVSGLLMILYLGSFPSKTLAQVSPVGIHFEEILEAGLAAAKMQNKPLFISVTASWCGPCKKLKKVSFANTEVGDFFNENFINVSLDGEKSDGKALIRKYQLKAYPSLIFLSPEGKLITLKEGFHSPEKLLTLGKKSLKNDG